MARHKRSWSQPQRAAASVRMQKIWAKRKRRQQHSHPAANVGSVHLARQPIKHANGATVDVDALPAPILLSLTLATREDLLNFITLLEREDWRIAEMRIARAS